MQCCPLRLTIIMLSGRSVKRTTALNNLLWWRKSFQLQNPKGLESQIHQLLYILLHHLSLVRKQDCSAIGPKPRVLHSKPPSSKERALLVLYATEEFWRPLWPEIIQRLLHTRCFWAELGPRNTFAPACFPPERGLCRGWCVLFLALPAGYWKL